jgi:hypothetical protein
MALTVLWNNADLAARLARCSADYRKAILQLQGGTEWLDCSI